MFFGKRRRRKGPARVPGSEHFGDEDFGFEEASDESSVPDDPPARIETEPPPDPVPEAGRPLDQARRPVAAGIALLHEQHDLGVAHGGHEVAQLCKLPPQRGAPDHGLEAHAVHVALPALGDDPLAVDEAAAARVDALLDLLVQGAALLADGKNTALKGEAEALARRILDANCNSGLSSPQLAKLILHEIRRLSGVFDPYSRFKSQEMASAKKIFSHIREELGTDLRSSVIAAVLGNSLDFFKNPDKTLIEIPSQVETGLLFFYDDLDHLEAFLDKGPELILYLADNAGEIYFDLPLYEYLRKKAQRTVLVVKGGPSLNDLTRVELKLAGLEARFDEVADTGTDGPGIDWDHISPEFQNLVSKADLIVSKGMANLETLYPRDLTSPCFFLLKVKCRPVQDYIGAPADSFCAMWEDRRF